MTEFKVVPDPLAFPNFDAKRSTLVQVTAHVGQFSREIQDMTDGLDILRQQLHAGMISIAEAREKIGGL